MDDFDLLQGTNWFSRAFDPSASNAQIAKNTARFNLEYQPKMEKALLNARMDAFKERGINPYMALNTGVPSTQPLSVNAHGTENVVSGILGAVGKMLTAVAMSI